MKRTIHSTRTIIALVGILILSVVAQGCREDLEGNLPVVKGELIGEYLQNNPDQFSEFTQMLDSANVLGLLNAYGLYTVFAPTNQALQAYYQSQGINGFSEMPQEDLVAFCYNHIIKGDTIKTDDFTEGALSSQSMSQRFISITFSDTSRTIFVNGNSPIIVRDIDKHNGFIHVLGAALSPSRIKLAEVMEADTLFGIYNEALKLTGWAEFINLAPEEDITFDPEADQRAIMSHTVPEEKPKSRFFGFTILAPSDASLANYTECPACPNGVHSLADLEKVAKYYYSRTYNNDADGITDYKDKKHYLNRFIAYHCFDRKLLSSRFIKDYATPHHFPQFDMWEYFETMLENTLLEVHLDRDFIVSNSEFGLLNAMSDPSKAAMFTDYQNKPDGGSLNGYYHEITKPIVYSRELIADISSKRLRLEACSFFPEIASNNMRGNNPTAVAGQVGRTHAYLLPNGYLEDFQASANTRLTYIGACAAYEDFQGDEIYLRGTYNFTMKTCPIPAGTYEIRMGYQPTAYRGIAQLYWDSLPCGIPLNLSLLADNPEIGYETPGSNADDRDGYENDKMMHNRGYMKGPNSYVCFGHWYGYTADNARLSRQSLRRVLGTYTFTETKEHYFTVISLGSTSNDTQFMLDYLEFCPTELLETEGID